MSDQQNTPSAREQWLSVALAVARDGMPHPRDLEVRDRAALNFPRVELTFDQSEPADAWAERLGLSRSYRELISEDGKRRIATYSGAREDGWRWTVTAYTPLAESAPAVPSDLAIQVTEAIDAANKLGDDDRALGLR